jgi:PAS domain S-box-containing protein
VSAEEFHVFFNSRDVLKNFPAISYTGFSRYIKNSQKEDLINEVNSPIGHLGSGSFKIYPETKNEFVAPVVYVEPYDVNKGVVGFDALSESNRVEAINRSIDSGEFVLSGEVTVHPSEKIGFIGYLPVYNKNITASSTVSERQSSVYGFISTVFEADTLFGNFTKNIFSLDLVDLDIEVYDGDNISPDKLLYDFNPSIEPGIEKDTSLIINTLLVLGGHNFTLSVFAPKGYIVEGSKLTPYLILGGGSVAGFLLFIIIYLLAVQYARAYVLAEKIAENLHEGTDKLLLKLIILESQLEISMDGVLIVDDKGKIVLSNKHFAEIWKMPGQILDTNDDKKMIGHILSQLKYPDEFSRKVAYLYENKDEKSREEIEFLDGRFLDRYSAPLTGADGKYYGRIWFFRDITDFKLSQKKVEEKVVELERSQKAIINVLSDIETEKNRSDILAGELQKFKLAVDNVSDHIIISDPDGKVIYANKAASKITGYSSEEIIGNRPSLWGKQMPKAFYENLWKTIKEDKVIFTGEVNNKRKNGELYVAEVNISPILNSKGEIIFFVGIERDITLLKEISDAKTEFVSVASHQLRTPLTGIKWLTEVLLKNRENNLSEKQKEVLKEINSSNDRIINLVNDLLSISRIERGQSSLLNLTAVEMERLINEVVNGLKPIAENKKIDLRLVIGLPKDYKLNIDEEKIRQAMTNLISNAIKYSKLGENGHVDISAELKKDEFVFSVKDSGIGIPVKAQRHLFEKFFRADNAILTQTEGTGLGLPIVKSYVEAHGGRVWFESEENKGSVFHFSLKTK